MTTNDIQISTDMLTKESETKTKITISLHQELPKQRTQHQIGETEINVRTVENSMVPMNVEMREGTVLILPATTM